MNENNKNVDPNNPSNQGSEPAGQNKPDSQGAKEERTFTQAELDMIVQTRLAAERKKMPSKDELAAYKAWEAEQKAKEPENKEAEEAKRQLAAAQAELERYKNKEKVLKAGIDPQFADYVTFEIGRLVDDATDFDTALITWSKTNEHFKKQDAQTKPQGAGGMRQGGAPAQPDGVEEAFYKLNPQLKQKEG